MKITHAELMTSAVNKTHYPKERLPEIALAGRSNVGKSSFINRMIQRRSLVRTSSKPGKTQTLNFYKLNNAFIFVDVPGYGYAKLPKKELKKWGTMMEEYFQTRENLKIVVLITDSRHQPTQDDVQMYQYLKYYELPVAVIATKIDKVKKSQRLKNINRIKDTLDLNELDNIIPFSAETGEGKEQVWGLLKKFI